MKSVAVVTSTRAEYGLLRPVLAKLRASGGVKVRLVVTGAHLSEEFGLTVREIEADGQAIDARIDFMKHPAPRGRLGTAKRAADAMLMFSEYFHNAKLALVLLLGDRYEIFAVAQAAAMLDIPVAHISGGDVTFGADDDWFRHCITKMAKLHFPSCEEYRRRILRMGEQPGMVFNVGGLGDENIRQMKLVPREELAEALALPPNKAFALVTYHPETAAHISLEHQADALLGAMEANGDLFYLITKANADAGGEWLNARLHEFCDSHENAALHASLGARRYLSAMRDAQLVLGNSSSGVVETPSFGTPTVDIGNRQKGRLTGANVLHVETDAEAISEGIQRVQTPEFVRTARGAKSPYNGGDTSGRIVQVLEEKLNDGSLVPPKEFYDGEAT